MSMNPSDRNNPLARAARAQFCLTEHRLAAFLGIQEALADAIRVLNISLDYHGEEERNALVRGAMALIGATDEAISVAHGFAKNAEALGTQAFDPGAIGSANAA